MNTFSAYVFRQVLGPLLAVLGALAAIAILTQGLSQLDIIISNRSAGFAFAWITFLALPQLLSLILPLAVFFAVLYALNRMHQDSEIAVAYGAGVSRTRLAAPILQLAVFAATAHLALNTVVQPWALRERRETIYAVRADVASSLVQEGAFTFPVEGLMLYARQRGGGGVMRDIMINDSRGDEELTYTARSGAIVTLEGQPTIVMRDGQIQRQRDDGAVEVLDFDRYPVQLGANFQEPEQLLLKASDRTLFELFFPDLTDHYDQRNVNRFLAEAHQRLSSPLLNIALALVALAGVLTGEFSRRGYARRMMIAAGAAFLVRLAALGVQAAAVDDPRLNALQYGVPLAVTALAWLVLGGRSPKRGRAEMGPSLTVRT